MRRLLKDEGEPVIHLGRREPKGHTRLDAIIRRADRDGSGIRFR